MNQSEALLNDLTFCVIDLETTGGNHNTDKIIEVGLVKIKNLTLVDEKNYLINPKMNIPDFIQKLTGIKQKDVENAPIIEEVIQEISEFIGDSILVAHNISFDIPFLNSVLIKCKKDRLKNKVICTNVMTKHMIPEIMNSNLNYMSRLFSIGHKQAHRASEDARATANLLLKYLEIFIKKNIRKINQLYYPRNKFELDRINYNDKSFEKEIIKLCKEHDSPLIITIKGAKGVILGSLPIESPPQEIDIIKKFLKANEWELCTLKLTGQILEGLIYINGHFNKFTKENADFILKYLNKKYPKLESYDHDIAKLDFIMAPHLIEEQYVIYPFLNLKSNSKFIFKFPSHKKKLIQFLQSKANYFKNNMKEKRKNNILPELVDAFNSVLSNQDINHQRNFLHIKVKELNKKQDKSLEKMEEYHNNLKRKYLYPSNFL